MGAKTTQDYRLTEEQKKLVEDNLLLAYAYAGRFKFPKWRYQNETKSRLVESLCRSAATWQPGQGAAFSTYAYNLFRFTRIAIWREFHELKNAPKVDLNEIRDPIDRREYVERKTDEDEENLLAFLLSRLRTWERELITIYYSGRPTVEIAKEMQLTPETIRQRIKAILRRLRIIAARYPDRINEVAKLCGRI